MFDRKEFTPKLATLLKEGISRQQIRADLVAGVIVGIVALPLAIAFAIASGVSPEKGLITAIVAGLLISALGGSRVQIGGPTGAFIVIVYGIVQEHGVEGLTLATFLAGFLLLGMGLLRFGALLRYIPHPLIVGFTSGIAVIIFSAQIRDLFGLSLATVPAGFLEKWVAYAQDVRTLNPWALGVGLGTIAVYLLTPRITTRVPGSLAAILLATAAVYFLKLPVETIETRFGAIPNHFSMPEWHWPGLDTVRALIEPAFAIAMLGGIESLLSAVVADGMVGGKHRSNMELVAQGAANIASAVMGGIPATGAIARTATNVKNGGRTPLSGIVHALTLLLIMLAAAPLAKLIPMACLAGILIMVAWNMGEWHAFASVFRGNVYDRMVLLSVFFLTVIFDLILAIEIGLVLSAFLFIKRMADITAVNVLEPERPDDQTFEREFSKLPKGVMLYEISGPLFFGASQTFQEALRQTNQKPRAIIINLRNVSLIDATGLYRLIEVVRKFNANGTAVHLCGFSATIAEELQHSGIDQWAFLSADIDQCLDQLRQPEST